MTPHERHGMGGGSKKGGGRGPKQPPSGFTPSVANFKEIADIVVARIPGGLRHHSALDKMID
jgi:hypothetical protein